MMLPRDVRYETWDANYMLDPRSIRLETLKKIFQRQLELGIRLATQSQHQQEIYHDISHSLIELGTCMSKDTNRETEPFQNLTSLIKNWTERRASSIEDTIIDHSSILIAFSQYQSTQDRFIYTDEFEARQRSLIHTMEAHKEHYPEKLAIFLLGRAHIFTETTDSLSSKLPEHRTFDLEPTIKHHVITNNISSLAALHLVVADDDDFRETAASAPYDNTGLQDQTVYNIIHRTNLLHKYYEAWNHLITNDLGHLKKFKSYFSIKDGI